MSDVLFGDMGELEDLHEARLVGDLLCQAYPGWAWGVHSARGSLSIKLLDLARFGQYGFSLQPQSTYHALRVVVLEAGGELLERAGLPRDRKGWDGVLPTHLEGADPNQARDPRIKRLAICEYLARTVEPQFRAFYQAQASGLKSSLARTAA